MTTSDQELAARLAPLGRPRAYRRGEALCVEGDRSDRVFIVDSGLVKITCSVRSGSEILLGLRGAGEVIGELSTLDGGPRSATIVALTKVESTVIASADVEAALTDPTMLRELLRVVAARLRDADRKRIEFAALDTIGRVAMRSLELADRFGRPGAEGIEVELPISQEEMASWCGASREATVKALRVLRELGYLQTARRSLTILDTDALRARARV